MRTYVCGCCGQLLFFENSLCLRCGSRLGFLAEQRSIVALVPKGGKDWSPWGTSAIYRLCANYANENVCNWLVNPQDGSNLCPACRLNRTVPDLRVTANRERWARLEQAKRRLVVELFRLNLPLVDRLQDRTRGLAFDFLIPDGGPVLTGHHAGVITINAWEADDDEREYQRVRLHEPYRTLLGHFRHEIGHYYWDRLVWDRGGCDSFRSCFGDERQDYARALAVGAQTDWAEKGFISAYASAHPWEDWAETWAHYMHLIDTLDTASDFGLQPSGKTYQPSWDPRSDFQTMVSQWLDLSLTLNCLNRSMGLQDFYPFVLAPPAIGKLEFIHRLLQSSEGDRS